MALFSSYNIVTTGSTNALGENVYNGIVAALLAGWTVQSYGTGTAGVYSATGAGFALASLTANSTLNWVCVQDPGGRTQIVFQLLASGTRWQARIKVSESAKFVGGSPSANRVPSATDELVIYGGGTDAAPTGESWSASNSTVHKCHAFADSSPINGRYPWTFYSNLTGTATHSSWFLQDPCLPGSTDPSDASPQVWAAGVGTTFTGNIGRIHWWQGYGTGSVAAKSMVMPLTQLAWDGARSVDPVSGNDFAGRIQYYPAAPDPPKGFSSWVLLKAHSKAFPNNINRDTAAYTYMGSTTTGFLLKSVEGFDLAV